MPMRIAVSPRAWIMKGDATWRAPSAAAPFISVRRLNFEVKAGDVMSSPFEDLVSSLAFDRPAPSGARLQIVLCQAGHCILQPVASAGPAAFSPGTGLRTVNILSGSPFGGWA